MAAIMKLIAWGKRVILLGVMTPVAERTPPTDNRAGIETEVAARNSILRRIAAGFNDAHSDTVLFIEMEHFLTNCPEYTAMGDGVHPNHAGYEAYAQRILTYLMG
jgi:lysophospholipase L1-like esterase